MRGSCRVSAALLLATALLAGAQAGCSRGEPDMSIRIVSETEGELFSCPRGTVRRLDPAGRGGFRFSCPEGDLYLEYDTDSPGDGTLERIVLNTTPERRVHVAADNDFIQRELGLPNCAPAAAAGRTTGEVPLPMQRGHLATGDHTILLSYPCGPATITVGAPLGPPPE